MFEGSKVELSHLAMTLAVLDLPMRFECGEDCPALAALRRMEESGGEPILLSGDTLFEESIGRTDLPTGSMHTLAESIRNKLYVLPDNTQIYSGHGGTTTIEHEKKYNYFVRP